MQLRNLPPGRVGLETHAACAEGEGETLYSMSASWSSFQTSQGVTHHHGFYDGHLAKTAMASDVLYLVA